MKRRKGFVSNSSSSSFIIAIGKDDSTKVTIESTIDLARLGEKITTLEELDTHMNVECCVYKDGTMDDYDRKRYDKMKVAIENGQVVIWGSFSSEGDTVEALLCERGLKGNIVEEDNIKIIESEGGY